MKTFRTIYTLLILATASVVVAAQNNPDEYLGLPGDNLNLYAVMNLFQESETLEGFERSLNDNESMINNLDLNGDNLIDYITVSDYEEGNVHTIVLRAALNKNEQQDIAVFVVEKLRNGAVQIQLIGDEALYGPNYIVEPIYAETPNPGYSGNVYRGNVNVVTTTYYDIAAWPMIRFIYRPGYVVWRSSWYWGYYPRYWRPWRPHYWHYYYGYHYHWHDYYYSHYHHWNHFRSGYYASYYRPRVRVYSPTVAVNINKGRYRNTYSRPDQRRAGEDYYTRTASNRSRPGVSTSVGNRPAVRTTSTPRTSSRSNTPAVQRSTNSRGNAVQRSQSTSSRSNTPAVQRSTNSRGNAVQRSQSTNSRSNTPALQRSTNSRSNTPAVQRSNNSGSRKSSATVSRSNSSRSTPSVKHSSSSRSTPSVQRSSSRKNSGSVSRSSSSRSTPSVKRSSSSSSRSSSVKRSQTSKSKSSAQRSSSSSRKSSGSQRSSRSSRR